MNKLINKIKIDSYGDLRPLNESELYQQRLYNVLSKFIPIFKGRILQSKINEIDIYYNVEYKEFYICECDKQISLETVESLLKDLEVE